MTQRVEFVDRESAFLTRLKTFAVKNLDHKDITAFLDDAFTIFNEKIFEILPVPVWLLK